MVSAFGVGVNFKQWYNGETMKTQAEAMDMTLEKIQKEAKEKKIVIFSKPITAEEIAKQQGHCPLGGPG